jgi:hypothetical protein
MESRVQSHFLLYLTARQHREQTGTSQNVANEYRTIRWLKKARGNHVSVVVSVAG